MNDDFRNILNEVKNDNNAFVFLDPPYLDCKSNVYRITRFYVDI